VQSTEVCRTVGTVTFLLLAGALTDAPELIIADILAAPVLKEGRGVPLPATNEAVSRDAGCSGGTRNRWLLYSVTSGHSSLSHHCGQVQEFIWAKNPVGSVKCRCRD